MDLKLEFWEKMIILKRSINLFTVHMHWGCQQYKKIDLVIQEVPMCDKTLNKLYNLSALLPLLKLPFKIDYQVGKQPGCLTV